MRFPAIRVVSLGFLLHLSIAQDSQATDNPLTVPACSTLFSIVTSCAFKLADANTVTASVFSCLCFDNSGNYIPTVYDNAVAGCSSQYSTDDFGFWLPGICTDTNYATNTAAAITTTAGGSPTAVVGITSNPTGTASGGAGVSSSPTATPGGLISTTTSKPTAITPAPTGTSAGAVGGVSSTISKADGMKIGYMSGDGSFWSIFGSILGAILML